MSTRTQQGGQTAHDSPAPERPAWDAITAALLAARARIFAELRNYPPPIAGCDVQFNRLLEQRDAIARELSRWEALRSQWAAGAVDEEALAAFVRGSAILADNAQGPEPAGTWPSSPVLTRDR
ncbi:MAG TPA: hypothetical protein VKB51_06720 [bacterium]|nr:hypothetical protein [bacterium]